MRAYERERCGVIKRIRGLREEEMMSRGFCLLRRDGERERGCMGSLGFGGVSMREFCTCPWDRDGDETF